MVWVHEVYPNLGIVLVRNPARRTAKHCPDHVRRHGLGGPRLLWFEAEPHAEHRPARERGRTLHELPGHAGGLYLLARRPPDRMLSQPTWAGRHGPRSEFQDRPEQRRTDLGHALAEGRLSHRGRRQMASRRRAEVPAALPWLRRVDDHAVLERHVAPRLWSNRREPAEDVSGAAALSERTSHGVHP